MSEMRAACAAAHLGANHAVAGVDDEVDGIGGLGLIEAGPPAAGFVLGRRIEQLGSACCAVVGAIGVLVDVLSAPGRFGTGATELIHIGQAVMAFKGTVEYFVNTVFNYPTLAECYKVAAYNGLNKLKHV